MDSQHRHELQQSDLANFLTHFGEWWRKNGLRTLLILLVVVGGTFIYRMRLTRVEQAHDAAWYDLSQATSADQYRGVARSHDLPAIHAVAHLRAGDWALRKALAPDNPLDAVAAGGEGGVTPKPVDTAEQRRKRLLDGAEQDFQAVLDYPAAHLTLKLNAWLGLAAVAESRGEWGKANEIYDKVQAEAGAGQERISRLAAGHAAALDRVQEPVIFSPEPPELPKLGDLPVELQGADVAAPAVTDAEAPVSTPAASQPDSTPAP